jgi:hypothetical protein
MLMRGGLVMLALPTMMLLFILHADGLVPDSDSLPNGPLTILANPSPYNRVIITLVHKYM